MFSISVNLGTKFYLGTLGSNCSVAEFVSELEDCEAAATQLGRTLSDHIITRLDRPAGCYYKNNSDFVHFNLVNATDKILIESTYGGVCKIGILQYALYKHISD